MPSKNEMGKKAYGLSLGCGDMVLITVMKMMLATTIMMEDDEDDGR